MAATIRGVTDKPFLEDLTMPNINLIAWNIRHAFATGGRCKVPLMTARDVDRVLALLTE